MSKKCTPLCHEAHVEQKCQSTSVSETFGRGDVEKEHAVVARSTFSSQNVQSTPVSATFGSGDVKKVNASVARSTCGSEHVKSQGFGPLFDDSMAIRCRKSSCRCGVKHIWKSKV